MKAFFKRYEMKYMLSLDDYNELIKIMGEYMMLDKYGKMLISNVYFDTLDYKIIRRSIEKPIYKEKLRVRFYNDAFDDAFIELKKKYDGVVYKRRLETSYESMYLFLVENSSDDRSQIHNEISYFMNVHGNVIPKVYISYVREAYFCKNGGDFRITFDHNIKMRDTDVLNVKCSDGINILDSSKVLLEVKTGTGLPVWLVDFFSSRKIYKTSFSKYGYSYKNFLLSKGEKNV